MKYVKILQSNTSSLLEDKISELLEELTAKGEKVERIHYSTAATMDRSGNERAIYSALIEIS